MNEAIQLTLDPVELAAAIDAQVRLLSETERGLDRNYARLGGMLAQMKRIEGWRALGFGSFAAYLNGLKHAFQKGGNQLWAYSEAADKLLPVIGEDKLNDMGVSKALELVRASKIAKQEITPELLEKALDPDTTANQVRAAAYEAFNVQQPDQPKGSWLDLAGFYVTSEERKEHNEAMELGVRLLDLKESLPEWVKRKEVYLAMVREFVSTHAANVYGIPDDEPVELPGENDTYANLNAKPDETLPT